MIQHLKKFDWILISSSLILVVIGLVLIYSISLSKGDFLDFKKQIIFFGISFILMIILSFFDWRAINKKGIKT
jgi:cell division protein FtsW (lipid II flippase)